MSLEAISFFGYDCSTLSKDWTINFLFSYSIFLLNLIKWPKTSYGDT